MRKIVFTIAGLLLSALLFTATAQEKNKDKKKDWDDKDKIEGSGNIVTKEINVQSFDELRINGVFELKLSQGNKEQLKIEADDNLQSLFEVKNEGSKLIVSMKKDSHFNSKKQLVVYITFKKLKSLDLSMVGGTSSDNKLSFDDLKIDNNSVGSVKLNLSAKKLDIENKSVGNFTLSGTADNAVVKHNGVGAFKASDLLVQTMDIDAQGVGSAEVNAVKELKVKDSFLGRVKNVGAAPVKKMNRVRV
jgi:hypothetical protein